MLGPESAGKTTLCEALRASLEARGEEAQVVPEAARVYLEALAEGGAPPPLRAAHFERIAAAQALLHAHIEPAAAARGARWLISDTGVILTGVWAEELCEGPLPDLRPWREGERFDLYLLLRPDLPWVGDSARYQPARDERERFFGVCEGRLRGGGLPYVVVEGAGEERVRAALEALDKISLF